MDGLAAKGEHQRTMADEGDRKVTGGRWDDVLFELFGGKSGGYQAADQSDCQYQDLTHFPLLFYVRLLEPVGYVEFNNKRYNARFKVVKKGVQTTCIAPGFARSGNTWERLRRCSLSGLGYPGMIFPTMSWGGVISPTGY
ncbi:hypothetical protein ES703_63561 [subsurface metagenome]